MEDPSQQLSMRSVLFSFASLVLIAGAAYGAVTASTEPIYVYLYARVTDHVNMSITEDRLHRVLPMVDKFRKQHPEARVSATILFSGAAAEALVQRNAQSRIVDFVKGYIRQGVIEVGYDGSDEPTYQHRPLLDFAHAQTAEDRWQLRVSANQRFLSEGRDPLTGAPDAHATGGLQKMREVFGVPAVLTAMTLSIPIHPGSADESAALVPIEDMPPDPHFARPLRKPPVFMSGLKPEWGGDSELVELLRRDGMNPIIFGVPDTNPGFIPGFTEGRAGFGGLISPAPQTAPELYWQDNVLRSSEASDRVRLVHASGGIDAIKAAIEKADRTRVHVVHVELASEDDYLQPDFIKSGDARPLKYAYDHPQSPNLPQDALAPVEAIEESYSKEEALLKWLVEDFFPKDRGSRVISNKGLMQLVEPPTGFSLSTASLRIALADYLRAAGNDTVLPPSFRADGHYLSLADMFQVLSDEFAEFNRTGKFPASVKVAQVYGPIALLTGHGPNSGEVSVAAIARVCAELAPSLHDESIDSAIPRNRVPNYVKVDGISMNSAQFLRLMAGALQNPEPDAKLPVRMTYSFTGTLMLYPKLRNLNDAGFGWTLKPAVLHVESDRNADARLGSTN